MKLRTIFFDLDSTLYPESNGLWAAIRERIDLYLHERMNLSFDEIPKLRHQYYIRYGTTLKGLQAHFDVDAVDYLNFVHDLPLDDYLQPDPRLREMLLSIPMRRWVFTNSDLEHTQRVLAKLNIEDCFEGIVDVWAMQPYCKPQQEAYQKALELIEDSDPQTCALLDDSEHNLAAARDLGFFTVLVGKNEAKSAADRVLIKLHNLPQIVPEFWDHARLSSP
ncbi:MAG: pyrimidine 5'-nucleotidase [Chloroflexota bacterium]|nr:pyrimidine 5'-nucleotidase [Chloroflexota bacterium]